MKEIKNYNGWDKEKWMKDLIDSIANDDARKFEDVFWSESAVKNGFLKQEVFIVSDCLRWASRGLNVAKCILMQEKFKMSFPHEWSGQIQRTINQVLNGKNQDLVRWLMLDFKVKEEWIGTEAWNNHEIHEYLRIRKEHECMMNEFKWNQKSTEQGIKNRIKKL